MSSVQCKRMVRFLWIALIFIGCATPEQLINRAIKKDPEVLRRHVKAEVIYVTDTVTVYVDGETIRVPVNVPVETTVIKWVKERTNKEERLDGRLQKAELVRFRLINDSLKANNKKLKFEAKLLKEEATELRKKNRSELFNWLINNWFILLMFILAFILLPNIIKWVRKLLEQLKSKQGR